MKFAVGDRVRFLESSGHYTGATGWVEQQPTETDQQYHVRAANGRQVYAGEQDLEHEPEGPL